MFTIRKENSVRLAGWYLRQDVLAKFRCKEEGSYPLLPARTLRKTPSEREFAMSYFVYIFFGVYCFIRLFFVFVIFLRNLFENMLSYFSDCFLVVFLYLFSCWPKIMKGEFDTSYFAYYIYLIYYHFVVRNTLLLTFILTPLLLYKEFTISFFFLSFIGRLFFIHKWKGKWTIITHRSTNR